VPHTHKIKNACRVLVGKPEGKKPHGRQWQRLYKHGSLGDKSAGNRLDSSGLGQGQMVGSFEYGNNPLHPINCGQFHQQRRY
jgi:hypothetical protein